MVLFAHPSGDYEIQDRYTLDRLGEVLGWEIRSAYLVEVDGAWYAAVYLSVESWDEDDFRCLYITG